MTDLFAARSQMAISLGFHIVFASIGIAMPFLMAISHWRWLKTKEPAYLDLTKAWSKGVAIFFATGAVSGTVLSFELGLLWPKFMEYAGPISGLPFAWEGTAFFLEAIALGIFLYGWDRIHPWAHWASGVIVGFSGVASGMFVICANGWMNAPAGFDWVDGRAINIDPVAAMFNRAALQQGLHMTIAAYLSVAFLLVGGIAALPALIGALYDRIAPLVSQLVDNLLKVRDCLRIEHAVNQLIHDDAVDFFSFRWTWTYILQAVSRKLFWIDLAIHQPTSPGQTEAAEAASNGFLGDDFGNVQPGQRGSRENIRKRLVNCVIRAD